VRIWLGLPSGDVVSLYRITRTPNGLYIVGTLGNVGAGQHLSYHTDGLCLDHSMGRVTRGRRRPLTGYTGEASILTAYLTIHRVDVDRVAPRNRVRQGDVLVDRIGEIGIEMILSESLQALPPLADRPNAVLHIIHMTPRLLIEVFDVGGALVPQRYPDPANWEQPPL